MAGVFQRNIFQNNIFQVYPPEVVVFQHMPESANDMRSSHPGKLSEGATDMHNSSPTKMGGTIKQFRRESR